MSESGLAAENGGESPPSLGATEVPVEAAAGATEVPAEATATVPAAAEIAPAAAAAPATEHGGVVHRHHLVVRVTHWVNALALVVMIGSGLRIYNASPGFAPKGDSFCCWPWEGMAVPAWATFGGWLGGARHWHFAAMWVLVVNGLAYLAFIWLHGEWRDLVPRRGFLRDSVAMVRFYMWVSKEHPRQGKHNALQRGAYFVLPYVGVASVVTGLAIWKPVQLGLLTSLLGGYHWARWEHFMAMSALIVLSLGHVFMVFAVDPYSIRSMLTGKYNTDRSPEERNARPFVNLFARSARPKEDA